MGVRDIFSDTHVTLDIYIYIYIYAVTLDRTIQVQTGKSSFLGITGETEGI